MAQGKDVLTGLNNEAYLRTELDNELARARRFGREVGLLLLEPALPPEERGDMGYTALKVLARHVGENTRVIDEGVRWGHQIVVVLPETARDGVAVVEGKVRAAFESHEFKNVTTGEPFHALLASAILVYPSDGTDKMVLLEQLRTRMLSQAEGPSEPASDSEVASSAEPASTLSPELDAPQPDASAPAGSEPA